MKMWLSALESGCGLTYHRGMGRFSFRRGAAVAALASLVCIGTGARADEPSSPPAASVTAPASPAVPAQGGPAVVLARLSSDPRTPDGYAANVELHVKLHSFPFIGATVHGTSTFRRPGLYHYHLDNLPRIAAKFDDLQYDLGDPQTWSQRYDITLAPESTDEAPALRLTPKHPGLVTALDIVTDARHARMLKATWMRRDGGSIVLTQTYAAIGAADVVTEQHAVIDIPHMRAELTATYTNVTIETPTFATVPEH